MRIRPRFRLLAAAPLLFVAGLAGAAVAAPPAPAPPPSPTTVETVPGQYIVVFKNGTSETQRPQIEKKVPAQVDKDYKRSFRGFSGRMSAADAQTLQSDPNVAFVAPVHVVHVLGQAEPVGMQRINAGPFTGLNVSTNVDVAVIDTGVDATHPDLNVAGGVGLWPKSGSCPAPSTSFTDDYGHGTEVAGVIAARDNGQGVVGVAPGARIWSVKALNCSASGTDESVLDSIEWILGRKQEFDNGAADGDAGINISVVNMSIGSYYPVDPSQDPLCTAISDSVAAGVTYVVAAANSHTDAGKYSPAHCPAAIAVSAMIDTDGKPGHLGPNSIGYGADDTFASFSNFGTNVKLAAPGVNIMTTAMGGAYTSTTGVSGTSFSSPHVAGAAALLKAATPSLTPAQVLSTLLAKSAPQNGACGFTGDPSTEPLLSLNGCVVTEARTPGSVAFTATGGAGVKGDLLCTGFCPLTTGWAPPLGGIPSERAPR